MDQLPSSPPGSTRFGQEMEPLVLDKIEQETGWTLERHPPGANGPDIVPVRPGIDGATLPPAAAP